MANGDVLFVVALALFFSVDFGMAYTNVYNGIPKFEINIYTWNKRKSNNSLQ